MSELRVLVADDDAVARRFFLEALAALGARAAEAGSGEEALAALARAPFDVLIGDLRMPGPAGEALAHAVRERLGGAAPRMLAMSGELAPGARARLLAAGFAEAFQKPIGRAALAALLGLGPEPADPTPGPPVAPPVLDDGAALRTVGNAATMIALRGLMRTDLPAQREALREHIAAGRREAAAAALHRMRASCGFCGAPRLAAASAALQRALEQGQPAVQILHAEWERCAAELESQLPQR